MHVLQDPPAVSPNVTAGVLLCARSVGEQLTLPFPSAREILLATSATRSRAYEVAREIRELLPALARSPGRPREGRVPAPADEIAELRGEVLGLVMKHPGCVQVRAERARYGERFRRLVLELRAGHVELPLSDFAEAICVPLGTVQDWLSASGQVAAEQDAPAAPAAGASEHAGSEQDAEQARIETVLCAWRGWSGDFGAFCEHVRTEHRLDLGNTMIASILFAHGERTPVRRGRRHRDEQALRGAFETFFPGAQWVLDGKTLEVVIDGEVLHVNLELAVDAASDAAVGVTVRDEEDSKAVTEALASGVQTTGELPVAALLDNRPSNHTPEVDAALGETMRIRATPGRAQNKAHVEGAFGLFAQKVPPIEVDTREPRALARTLALLVATTFFRALNRAPRRDRGGRTRADLHAQTVTPAQREAARQALQERLRKQELARQTRAARQDPIVAALLDDAFARLELLDPERHLRDAIACYLPDSIVDAIAIFDGKRRAGTLPQGVDARYLLGIVRNVQHVHEADAITEALLRERLCARDRFLEPLVGERDQILAGAAGADVALDAMVDRLVGSERTVDRHFWLDAAKDLLAPQGDEQRRLLARRAAHRIHAAFRLRIGERDRLVRSLLRRLWPLA